VTLAVPAGFSAHVHAETVNGGIATDFPVVLSGKLAGHQIDFNLGAGGPPIHLSTTNGGVSLRQL
jgi:hypothetical protein